MSAPSKKTIALKPLRERLDDWLTGNASFNSESEYQAALDRMEAALTPSPVAPGGLYEQVRDKLLRAAETLNGGEYKTLITHTIMPIVLSTIHRAAPVATEETQRPLTFERWFELWDTTGDPEIKRLCQIAFRVGTESSAQPRAETPEQATRKNPPRQVFLRCELLVIDKDYGMVEIHFFSNRTERGWIKLDQLQELPEGK